MPKALVIRGGAVGDFILTIPAITLLRDGLPDVAVEVLGYREPASLAEEAGIVAHTRAIEHAALAHFFVPGADLDPAWQRYFADFAIIVSYLFDPEGIFQANLERSGVKTLLQGPHQIDPKAGTHAARQLAAPLESLALYLENPAPQLAFAQPKTQTPSLEIALHPGSGSLQKNWSQARWVEVCARIREILPDTRFLITSGEAEDALISPFLEALSTANVPHRHLAHQPLIDVAREIGACRLYLGHDSGMSHLAAATGTPSLLLFGPTDPAIWAPQNPGVEILAAPGGDLHALSSSAVARAALRLLGTC